MSLWNKIVLGFKFLFNGFESATDYALVLLNRFLAADGIAADVQKARAYVVTIYGYLDKYRRYCPVIWVEDYAKLLVAVKTLSDAFEDNQIDKGEIDKSIAAIKDAIAEWMK